MIFVDRLICLSIFILKTQALGKIGFSAAKPHLRYQPNGCYALMCVKFVVSHSEFHREIKQLTGIESCQYRKARIGEKSYCLCYVGLAEIEKFS